MSRIPQYKPDDFKPILDINWEEKSTAKKELNEFFIEPLQVLQEARTPSQPHRKTVNDFIFIRKGSVEKMVCSSLFDVQEGMIMLLPPHKIRTFIHNTPDVEGFYCHFSNDFIADGPGLKYLQDILNHADIIYDPTLFLDQEHRERIFVILQQMESLYQQNRNLDLIRLYLFTLLGEIRHFIEKLPHHDLSVNETLVFRFRKLITSQIQNLHSVKEYADLLSVSPNHLNKTVKNTTGKTASEIINESLLMEAKALLSLPHLSVSEIAFALGVEDVSYFSRFFKKHSGTSPSDYRKGIDLS
ncbi:helix-turn-helix domain-containing protein [Chryseobacterium herbae]|uniref:Helix-turn-helix transcriptional regulator n=1 Tax=Chryseobacterium herbae TaxID=2976476 RepID=A0ABT2IP89_9FLAO|nr:AraC family transcriptional regulator [Chryseobacterium sp. pc1-10]MCT2560582.1 helix-turn-helix transcriptional regulator [Chryseobacterium sp. pc1-10]